MAEPLPLYVQDPQSSLDVLLTRIAVPISATRPDARIILESFVEIQKAPAYDGPETSKSPDPIDHYPHVEKGHIPDDLMLVKQQIVNELFNAIRREDTEAIALLIQLNLVTANTTSQTGQTPLLEAISTKKRAIVKGFLDLGADWNRFGVVPGAAGQDDVTRTPLMLAASIGSLPIVKLLFQPPYSANDALVAPDGQIALRLAAENDHRAIVDYLPSRRAGGFLRFKKHNARSIERIKKALCQLVEVIKIFVWYLPKFIFWTVPMHLLVLPVVRSRKWYWANTKRFGCWCKHQLIEMPKRVVNFGKAVWNVAKEVSKAVWKAAKMAPDVIWKAIKGFADTVWKSVKKAPEVIWKAIKGVGEAIWKAVKKAPEVIWKAVKGAADAVWNAAKKAPEVIWKAIKGVAKAVWNAAKKAPEVIWKAIKGVAKAVWNAAKKAPEVIWREIKEVAEAVWKAVKRTLGVIWQAIKDVAEAVRIMVEALWNFLTVRIPNAIRIALKWTWDGLSSLARAIGDIFLRFVSFLHLIFEATVTFLRDLTLRDIWNAFCDFLRAIFVTVPKTLWSWIESFGEASFRFMKALLGEVGVALWWFVTGLKNIVIFIPEKLGIILLMIGGSFAKAFSEIRVWISPKA